MFKSVIAASAALPLFAGAAVAGPHVNLEALPHILTASTLGQPQTFIGYEGAAGRVSYYVQGGHCFRS